MEEFFLIIQMIDTREWSIYMGGLSRPLLFDSSDEAATAGRLHVAELESHGLRARFRISRLVAPESRIRVSDGPLDHPLRKVKTVWKENGQVAVGFGEHVEMVDEKFRPYPVFYFRVPKQQ